MSSPFELSLQEYGLLWQPVTYDQKIQLGGLLPVELSDHAVQMGVDFTKINAWWIAANSLRHYYHETDPKKSRLYLAWMLKFDENNELTSANHQYTTSVNYQYTLDLMSGWARGQDDAQAVQNLLSTAVESRGYTLIEIACLFEAAQICRRHQMLLQARRLCAACFIKQEYSPPPTYVLAFYRELVAQTSIPPLSSAIQSPFNPLKHQDELLVRCFLEDLCVSDIAPKVLEASQAIIILKTKDVPTNRTFTSRLGGLPDVEEDWKWPDKLEFLAQLNLEELAPYDVNGLLPKQGFLRFFMRNLAYGWDEDSYRVEFYMGDLKALRQAQVPDFLTDMRFSSKLSHEDVIYKEIEIEGIFGSQISIPDSVLSTSSRLENMVGYLSTIFDADRKQHEGYQVLGMVSPYAVTSNADEENEWVLLFAIDSCYETGMTFSDAGTMYFHMKREDLLARRFDRVEVSMING